MPPPLRGGRAERGQSRSEGESNELRSRGDEVVFEQEVLHLFFDRDAGAKQANLWLVVCAVRGHVGLRR